MPAKNVEEGENMALEDVVSPRTLFSSILNDKFVKAAYEQYKSQPIKCKSSSTTRHRSLYLLCLQPAFHLFCHCPLRSKLTSQQAPTRFFLDTPFGTLARLESRNCLRALDSSTSRPRTTEMSSTTRALPEREMDLDTP